MCILANSRQHDLVGAKMMKKLREVSNDQIEFSGYGGEWMKKEGFEPTLNFDPSMLPDKTFVTYRKGRNMNEN